MRVIILAGGRGNRFWPRSTEARPKQFLPLTSRKTMLQITYDLFRSRLPRESLYVATVARYKPLVLQQLEDLGEEQLIVEPEQKDTGPCIALAAHYFLTAEADDVLVTIPSDQHIPDGDALLDALREAERLAVQDRTIVTLGIPPTRPETGYGYILADGEDAGPVRRVRSFIEKPEPHRAAVLLQQPNVYWNSGIYVWKPSTIAYYMKREQPDLWRAIREAGEPLETVYSRLPNLSVDYAVVEKADRILTIPVSFEWDDVGSWTSLERIFGKDENGSVIMGEVHSLLSRNNIVFSDSRKALVLGVDNLIIVSTAEGLLVCHKSMEQQIKRLLRAPGTGGGPER